MGTQTFTLHLEIDGKMLMTDISVKLDLIRSKDHWLLHLLNRGLILPGQTYQLRTRAPGFQWGRLVASGMVEVAK